MVEYNGDSYMPLNVRIHFLVALYFTIAVLQFQEQGFSQNRESQDAQHTDVYWEIFPENNGMLSVIAIPWRTKSSRASLPDYLKQNKLSKIRSLTIRGCSLLEIAKNFDDIPVESLQFIELYGCNLSKDDMSFLLSDKLHLAGVAYIDCEFAPGLSMTCCKASLKSITIVRCRGDFSSKSLEKNFEGCDLLTYCELASVPVTDLTWTHSCKLLRFLGVENTQIDDDAVRAILACKCLSIIKIGGTLVTSNGVSYLAAIPTLRSITLDKLTFSSKALADLSKLPKLSFLSLKSCDLGASHLQGLSSFEKLESLNMANCNLDDAKLSHLKAMTELKELVLDSNPLTDDAANAIIAQNNLRRVSMSDTRLTNKGVVKLAGKKHLSEVVCLRSRVNGEVITLLRNAAANNTLHVEWKEENAVGEVGGAGRP